MANPQSPQTQTTQQGSAQQQQSGSEAQQSGEQARSGVSSVPVRRQAPTLSSFFNQPFGSFLTQPFAGSPFGFVRRMMEDFDRMMAEMTAPLSAQGEEAEPLVTWSPQIEIFQRGDELVVRADLPGLREQDLRVEVVEDALVLEGERRTEHEQKERGFYRSEVRYGKFRRVIPLPEGADVDNANAKFENGVLEVAMKVPVEERRQPRRIEIKSGASKEGEGTSIH